MSQSLKLPKMILKELHPHARKSSLGEAENKHNQRRVDHDRDT
jgi:hypothetical protein